MSLFALLGNLAARGGSGQAEEGPQEWTASLLPAGPQVVRAPLRLRRRGGCRVAW